MKSFSKLLVFILVLLSVSLFTVHRSLSTIRAADAVPDPVVPCTETDYENPEFNSGRPYQASPCRDSSYALMCGNNIQVTLDKVSVPWIPGVCTTESCPYYKDTSVQEKHVVIDLSNVKLPILGNTQNVVNSQNSTDEFDDAQKLNEYVSWYLGGANQKAEYGEDARDKIVNFSGPAKKLLPSAIQEFNRFAVLWTSGVSNPITLNELEDSTEDYVDEDPDEEGVQTEQTANHNQIVVCTRPNAANWILGAGLSTILNLLGADIWIGSEKPVPCYDGLLNKITNTEWRLHQWWDGKKVGLIESVELIEGWDGSQRWTNAVPPFPWQFSEDIYYEKAYNEWRGKECSLDTEANWGFIARFFGKKLLCTDIRWKNVADFHSNVYADLYQYIPLSNTVDKKGKESYSSVHVTAPKAKIIRHQEDSSIEGTFIESVPRLFYPHTLEVKEASENLNKTYLPKEGVDTKAIPVNTEENTASCQILDVRTNPGDDLTFDNTEEKHQIDFTVYYKIDSVECTESTKTVDPCKNDSTGLCTLPPYETQTYNCDSEIYATLDLTTMAPYLDDVWETTTAGAGSTFRMIYPKVEEGAPVSCIADIPGVSPATFELNSASDNSVSGPRVKNPGGSTAVEPEIYFPHLGSVYEYFLKGIQTALRPQGYGEPITNGTACIPAGEGGDCSFDPSKVNAAISNASSKYNVDPAILRAVYEIEAAPYIADPGSFKCEENSAHAAGIAQVTKSTYDFVTCGDEKMSDDIKMCASKGNGMSRCDTNDAIELMARVLLLKAGRLSNCQSTGSITLADKMTWYNATCNYYGSFNPDALTNNYVSGIPANEVRPGGQMNYCDIVCHKLGQCPPYP